MLLRSYDQIGEQLAEYWDDAWQDPYAREWEHLARVTWRVLRRYGSESIAWTLDTPERRLDFSLRNGVSSSKFGVIVPSCPRLADRHADMAARREGFIARYPRFELKLAMQDVSEDHDASSWPEGWEWRLWRWAGGPVEADRLLADPRHHPRLARLRSAAGGWWVLRQGYPYRLAWTSPEQMAELVAAGEAEDRRTGFVFRGRGL